MATNKKILVDKEIFPSHSVSDSEKESKDFGLQVGRAIQFEWFKKSGTSVKFYDQWVDYHKLRLYARGEQPIEKYKAEFAVENDLTYVNLDWTPVKILPKFIDIVVNGISNRDFEVKAKAEDPLSAENKNRFQQTLEKDMLAREFLKKTKEAWGVDAFNVEEKDLPTTDQELELYMHINFKPANEIAEEVAISNIFNLNDYLEVKSRLDMDTTVLGVAMAKHSFSPETGVKIEYVDPAYTVHSYTESPTFDDCFYFGEVKNLHIEELRKIKPTITDEEIAKYRESALLWNNEYSGYLRYQDHIYRNETTPVLFYCYKTTKRFVYKVKKLKNGGERVIERDDSFVPSEKDIEEGKYDVVSKTLDVWYEGAMVLGATDILKWELQKNMVRPKAATPKCVSPYIAVAPRAYKGSYDSLCKRMIPFADQIQLIHLKLQHLLSRLVPDGVFIDADGLNEVDLGTGNAYNPEDALKLYFQTGSVVGRSYTQDGEFNNARVPIQELGKNDGMGKMQALIGQYNHYLNMIRDATGLNEAVDGSKPDSFSLVGLQKLAAANSNTATRHILKAGLTLTKKLAEACSLRISDILEYAEFREEFAMQVGKYNMAILDEVKNLYRHSFGIYIEVSPDEEEKAQLEGNIQTALSAQLIDLDDAIDIRQVKNIKLANELLKHKKRKREELRQQNEERKMQMQAVLNNQSQQAAAQTKMQSIQAEMQSKIAVIQAESEAKINHMQAEAQLKSQLMDKEFELNMQLKQIDLQAVENKENLKEDRKDERVKKQGTVQSKLIEQRKKDLDAIDFESTEDTLDGFDFAEFEPR